jgi:hypothetical protein
MSELRPTWSSAHDGLSLRLDFNSGYFFSDSPSTPVLQVQAITNPLLEGREGRFSQDGNNAWIEPQLAVRILSFLDLVARPSLHFSSDEAAFQDDVDFNWQQAYAVLHLGDLLIEVGRDSVLWGVGRIGNLVFSGNNEPLNVIRLRNAVPLTLPSFLSVLGPSFVEAFVTKLDEHQVIPDPYLVASKISFQPQRDLELGLGYTVEFGGEGAPSNDPLLLLGDSFTDVTTGTNRNFTIDVRYRWRELNMEPYAEILVEDCCDEVLFNARDMMNLVGLYLPSVDADGKLDLTLEWARTNQITYRHGTFNSGYEYRGRILGHELGPDANGLYAQLRYWFNSGVWLKSLAAFETRGRRGLTISDGPVSVVVPTYQVPESRYRWVNELEIKMGAVLAPQAVTWLHLEAGYEWTTNFDFIEGNEEPHLLGGLALRTSF